MRLRGPRAGAVHPLRERRASPGVP